MSTLQLTPEHLSAIVYGCTKYHAVSEYLLTEELNAMMIELLAHNCDEFNQTYKTHSVDMDEMIAFYEYTQPRKPKEISAIQFFKLAQCYQYNASASTNWENSKAKSWTDSLMHQAIASLPEYNNAKWSI